MNKIKLHLFQNIFIYLIHVLIPIKYKNKCKLCDDISDKDNRRRIILKKCFVLHEEFMDIFHENNYIPTIEKLQYHLSYVSIIASMECRRTRNGSFHESKTNINLKKYYSLFCSDSNLRRNPTVHKKFLQALRNLSPFGAHSDRTWAYN